MGKRAAIYCRISKDSAGLGLGVERQQAECTALCEARGWAVVETLTDNDISAYSGKPRPAYERLVDLMEGGDVDVVVCWHPDRLTRKPTELEALIDTLDRTSTTVATVRAGDYDLSTPSARMSARIVGAVARGESEHKSDRLKSKSDQLAASGSAPGGRTPYGYDRDRVDGKSVYVVNEDQATELRWMAERVLDGRSLLSIANELDARGVPTKEGKPWHHSTVRAVLVNPAVAGLRVHRREVAGQGDWEPILDRATWESTRALLSDPARKRKQPARAYLLSGLIESEGGDRMVGRPQNGRRTYVTPAATAGWTSIDADRTETIVIEAVLQRFDEKTITIDDTSAEPIAGEDVRQLEAELAELATARGSGAITFAEWMAAREPLAQRIEAAQAVSAPIRRNVGLSRPGGFREAWEATSDLNDRRDLLREAIDAVVVTGAGGMGLWSEPADRIRVRYRR